MKMSNSLWAAVKDNWGQITVGATLLTTLHLFIMWVMVGNAVTTKLSEQDIATDSKIVSMDDEIDENGAKADANTTRIDGNERRVEQAFAALMGRSIPDDE
jgi:hypothetical protein